MTTTYTDDVFGLTQVLVADDGTNEVSNLYGPAAKGIVGEPKIGLLTLH